jgi:O-antigen/teichoic acid export membrane protein
VGVFLGYGIPGIVALLVVFRWLALAIFCFLCIRLFQPLKVTPRFRFTYLRDLASFGTWVTVSSIAGPLLVYMDRFMIGTLLTMTFVAYYSAPYEIVSRFMIVPSSLVATLFPAFSTLTGSNEQTKQKNILVRSLKYLFLVAAPFVILMVFFAKDILTIWLGTEYAQQSTLVFQILFVGMFLNSLASLPHSLIQGIGRPDIPAKFHLLELVPYVGIAWFLIGKYAIVGAALAWTFRVALDGFLLWAAAWKLIRIPQRLIVNTGLLGDTITLVWLAGALKMITLSDNSLSIQVTLAAVIMLLFALFVWCYSLNSNERKDFKLTFRQLLNKKPRFESAK